MNTQQNQMDGGLNAKVVETLNPKLVDFMVGELTDIAKIKYAQHNIRVANIKSGRIMTINNFKQDLIKEAATEETELPIEQFLEKAGKNWFFYTKHATYKVKGITQGIR